MPLPLRSPLPPQLARSRSTLPEGDGWAYEPKYDGFRAIAFVDGEPVELTPMVTTAQDADRWLQSAEGVIAKETAAPYRPGERVGMVKVKRVRTIDAVVLGYRPGKAEGTVGSLILGLYDENGKMREV